MNCFFKRLRWAAATCAVAAASPWAHALPMAPSGGVMVMGDFTPGDSELAANYALSSRNAFGASILKYERMHGPRHAREVAALTWTHKLQRWNLPHAQANLWLVGMAGQLSGHALATPRSWWSPSFMADYETTRVYLGGGLRTQRAGSLTERRDLAWLRSGFAFTEADYEGVQPWFILEAKRLKEGGREQKNELTPMLRFIHKQVFLELGVTRASGEPSRSRVNFMLVQ
jgi:hypothetical protein